MTPIFNSMLKKTALVLIVLTVSTLGFVSGRQIALKAVQTAAFQLPKAFAEGEGSPAGAVSSSVSPKDQADRYKNLELFQKVLHFVESNYVEEVKNKDLVYGAIKGMMETLDPHSNFLPPDVFKDMKIDTSGKFGGLGIEIGMRDGVLTVVAPIEDTPAWKAGLQPNDRIVKIDGASTKGLNLTEAVSKMRGKKGSKVNLTIYRKGFEKVRDVAIVRDIIKIQSVKSEVIEPQFGYVRLASFNENAAADVKRAIQKIEEKGKLKGLVLDMRMNPGGLLDQAVEVTSLFIDEGVVVSTVGRNKNQKEIKHARKGNARKDFPVAILVNSSSASAAEIVAGALQDHHRAIVMGQPTFGKGSVQTVIELGQDMGLKLTIARYYTPSGKSIQEKGVTPDILLEQYDTKKLDEARIARESTREKDLPGHMVNEEKGEYSHEELESIDSKNKKGDDKAKSGQEDDMTPMKFEPQKDYQVREAVNYLKSYEIFKKLPGWEKGQAASSGP